MDPPRSNRLRSQPRLSAGITDTSSPRGGVSSSSLPPSSPSSPPSSPSSLSSSPFPALAQSCCILHPDTRAKGLDYPAPPPYVEAESDKHSHSKNKESGSTPNPTPFTTPIPIPAGCSYRRTSAPPSPLSAREKPGAYFPLHETVLDSARDTRQNNPIARASLPTRRKNSSDRHSTQSTSSPTTPLSPKMDSTVMTPAAQIKPRKNGALQLNGLPRFHPANYQSPNTSSTFTSTTAQGSTPRHYSDAQLQLHQYQRELIANATRGKASSAGCARPVSPRLIPLGSPGPVTPLMLEEEDGYLVAGASNQNSVLGESGQKDLVERLIQEESSRHRESQSERAALAGGRR